MHVGSNGRISDGGVFKNTNFYQALEAGTLGIPREEALSDNPDHPPLPYVFAADDVFAFKASMKPLIFCIIAIYRL